MYEKKKKCKGSKALMRVGGLAVTITGLIVIPSLVEKYSNKMYKNSLKNEKIDFDNMEPEIIAYDKK